MIKIAVIGFGNIGGGLVELVDRNKDIIARDCGTEVEIKYIVDIRDFKGHPLEHKIVSDFNIVLNDPEVSIVAEMIGGSHPAFDFSLAALNAGKHVVSSNKEVVANFGEVLLKAAADNNVAYLFEASVGGAIPIIRPMRESLSSDKILGINGILNGTTNFILTKMLAEGAEFDDALQTARELGYAEANPSADVDGIDACRKISILAALAYGTIYPCELIHTEGIRAISARDASDASELGAQIKLIGHAEKLENGKVLISVAPRFVPVTNPLSGVSDVFNGILVSGEAVGDLMFYGRGAGRIPTAGAVLADIVEIVKHITTKQLPPAVWTRGDASTLADNNEVKGTFYCRVKGTNAVPGATQVVYRDDETACKVENVTRNELNKALEGFEATSVIAYL